MQDVLLKYYNDELSYLRKQGELFAKAHPKIAHRLRLGPGTAEDPFVSRLLEAFAFLTARVHYQLDTEHQTYTKTLLNLLYPHYALPIPAMSILKMTPKPTLDQAYTVPRHCELRVTTTDEQSCYFRTTYPVTLYPIDISDIRYETHPTPVLTITLQSQQDDLPIKDCQLESLRFFINLEPALANQLYEQLFNQLDQITIHDAKLNKILHKIPTTDLKPIGFDDNEALLPYPANSFSGYRLLTEYFCYPEKFLFIELTHLKEYCHNLDTTTLQIQYHFKQRHSELSHAIDKDSLQLYCTPIVNLFERIGEPIQYDRQRTEYPIVPDAHQPAANIEIYQINHIKIAPTREADPIHCCPYFGKKYAAEHATQYLYWQCYQHACTERGLYQINGYEYTVAFSEFGIDCSPDELLILTPYLTCTNRDLPAQLPIGQQQPACHFHQKSHTFVDTLYCITPMIPTRHRTMTPTDIDLITHICLNQIDLTHAENTLSAIRDNLSLYHYRHDHNGNLINQALCSATLQPSVIRHPDLIHNDFCHGTALSIEIDESLLPDNNAFLFGSVLHIFLSKLCSINAFIQLTFTSKQRGIIHQWQPRLGIKQPI